jgi:amidase
MTDIEFRTARELASDIAAKKISSLELTDRYIERIERRDDGVNAVVVRDFERAREAAQDADTALAAGLEVGPLHGVPMTIKESYDIEGLPTTWGIPQMKANIAHSDAESVKSYKAAGAHFLGKTNVPLNLADFQSYNEIYGTTNNPWDPTRTPGGSSGGSAAALAAGFTALESGSDIGGSIRNPAHYCGVYGHKPTWGIVPSQGHALPGMVAGPDIAVCGPLARSAEDLALSMDVLAGAEPLDRPGWKLALPKPERTSLSEFRVAVWADDAAAPVAGEVADRISEVGETLNRLGATVSDQARPDIDIAEAHANYLEVLNAVMGAAVPAPARQKMREAVAALDPADRSMEAMNLRGTVIDHADWLRANHRRERLRYAWRDFFDDWDILLCPQTATPAFTQDESPMDGRLLDVDGVSQPYFQQLFWAGIVVGPYLCSTVFPSGPSRQGLPIGIQAVGAEYDDLRTIDFTRLLAREIGGFVPPPTFA